MAPCRGESHVRDLQQFICNNYTRKCEEALFRRADGLRSLWNPGCRCHDNTQSTVFGERCALFRSPTWSGCVILACPFHRTTRALFCTRVLYKSRTATEKGQSREGSNSAALLKNRTVARRLQSSTGQNIADVAQNT